jgi:hypothetical protein
MCRSKPCFSAASGCVAARPLCAPTSPSCSTRSCEAGSSRAGTFDFETDLETIAEAYAANDERRAIKSLVRIGTG